MFWVCFFFIFILFLLIIIYCIWYIEISVFDDLENREVFVFEVFVGGYFLFIINKLYNMIKWYKSI